MTLEQIQSAKYLNIASTDTFDWGNISPIASKVTKSVGFFFGVNCLLHLSKLWDLNPNSIEYAGPIWHLYLKTQLQQIEKI